MNARPILDRSTHRPHKISGVDGCDTVIWCDGTGRQLAYGDDRFARHHLLGESPDVNTPRRLPKARLIGALWFLGCGPLAAIYLAVSVHRGESVGIGILANLASILLGFVLVLLVTISSRRERQ